MISSIVDEFGKIAEIVLSRDFRNKERTKINVHATTVRRYFEGYPFVCVVDDAIGQQQLMDWCKDNCEEWNHGYFRASESDGGGDWVFNEVSGGDLSVWAFTKEADATMFALKWK